MALSKEFDAKNGFLGGINIKPMNVSVQKVESPKEEKKEAPIEKKTEDVKPKATKAPVKKEEPKKQKPVKEIVEVKAEPEEAKPVNKGGRPKKYDVEKVRTTLFFPEDLLEDMDIAKIKFNGSRTDYIIDLVRKDLEKNKAEYETLKKIFNK